jgi:hypothetical protein
MCTDIFDFWYGVEYGTVDVRLVSDDLATQNNELCCIGT